MMAWCAYLSICTWTLVLAFRSPTSRLFRTCLVLRESAVQKKIGYSIWRFNDFLKEYEQNLQSRSIPSDFIVPATSAWSAELHGKSYSELLYAGLQERSFYSDYIRSRLRAFKITMPLHYEAYMFNITVQALETYSHEFQDLLVPQTFVVPMTSPWPPRCWNLPLGQLVYRIRNRKAFIGSSSDRKQILDDMYFVWNVTEFKHRQFQDAIQLYQQWNGHLNVPKTCAFPDLDIVPRHLRNYNFGDVFNRYNLGQVFKGMHFEGLSSNASLVMPQRHAKPGKGYRSARRSGVCQWSVLNNATSFEALFAALVCFKDRHGHLFIPPYYVPSLSEYAPSPFIHQLTACRNSDLPWPVDLLRVDIGSLVGALRDEYSLLDNGPIDPQITDRLTRLQGLGLILDHEENLFEEIYYCLRLFISVHGHVKVPSSYSIPLDDAVPWPQHYRGKSLGQIVQGIRNGRFSSPDHRKRLDELGFVWKGGSRDLAFEAFKAALTTHYELFGDYNVPRYFAVPASPEWPNQTWGLQLGYQVSNFRRGKTFKKEKYRQNLLDHGIIL